MNDQAASWGTTLLSILALVGLSAAVVFSAQGPGLQRQPGDVIGTPGPSESAKDLDRGDTFLFGAWLGAWPTDDNDRVREFERTTGTDLDIVDIYLDWSTPAENVTHSIRHVTEEGAIPHLSWEPQGITTQQILNGERNLSLRGGGSPSIDAYLESFATTVCEVSDETGDPVIIRPMHEMNGNWFHWSTGFKDQQGEHPNTDETYRQAYRKIHNAFEAACTQGGDVRFVWAVNHVSLGENTSFTGTYPGDDVVDYVGIDGYNWGGVADWGWNTFPELFDRAYCQVTAATDKPVFISEWGSVEQGGDKPAWIRTALDRMANGTYPEVTAMIWLNDLKQEREIGDAVDWRVNSTAASLEAYATGVEDVTSSWTPRTPGGEAAVCS